MGQPRSRSFRAAAAVAALSAALLFPASAHAQAEPPSPVDAAVDLVFMRPVGLIAMVVGAILFVPVAVVSAPQGKDGLQEAWEQFVVLPTELTIQRPLGDF